VLLPFTFLENCLRNECCGEKYKKSPHPPSPSYVKLMNYVQLTSADASSDLKNKWKRRKVNKGERE